MISFRRFISQLFSLVCGLIIFFVLGLSTVLAAPLISRLVFNNDTHTLLVEGTAKTGPVVLYDAVADQRLAIQALIDGKFTFSVHNLSVVPSSVRVMAGNETVEKTLSENLLFTTEEVNYIDKTSGSDSDRSIQLDHYLHFYDPKYTPLPDAKAQ